MTAASRSLSTRRPRSSWRSSARPSRTAAWAMTGCKDAGMDVEGGMEGAMTECRGGGGEGGMVGGMDGCI